ncbi:MAG TPA: hypothetical protein VLQ91_19460 [Draconibacterium sp.]|nr:hypothetical protein [Draconibacterium sp.]
MGNSEWEKEIHEFQTLIQLTPRCKRGAGGADECHCKRILRLKDLNDTVKKPLPGKEVVFCFLLPLVVTVGGMKSC